MSCLAFSGAAKQLLQNELFSQKRSGIARPRSSATQVTSLESNYSTLEEC